MRQFLVLVEAVPMRSGLPIAAVGAPSQANAANILMGAVSVLSARARQCCRMPSALPPTPAVAHVAGRAPVSGRRGASLLVAVAFAAGALAGPSAVGDDLGPDDALRLLREGRILPLATLLDRLAATVPGHVVEMELEDDDGALVYDFKVLSPDGRLSEVEVDAATGEVLAIEDDD
ncbi:MAG: PepSY domain-containing protein [Hyphomicrobiaceae bacterium]|nr:PepSY domain-containing protein [Hyphomicrobiaceae bacterium]